MNSGKLFSKIAHSLKIWKAPRSNLANVISRAVRPSLAMVYE